MKAKLLIVEDDLSNRAFLKYVLSAMGYEVRTAENGLAALAAIREQVPDILLSDLNMPGMSGIELLSIVSSRFPDVRAIAMSGAFSGCELPPGVQADAFYEKGSGKTALLRAIEAPVPQKRQLGGHPHPLPVQTSGQNAFGG